MTVAGPISAMVFIRDSTVLACAIGNKIFLYKVHRISLLTIDSLSLVTSSIMVNT